MGVPVTTAPLTSRIRLHRCAPALMGIVLATGLTVTAAPTQQPTFRSGVDVVAVNRNGGGEIPGATVVGGDATSAAIAAASVIAKVTRDRFMQRAAKQYPHWEFESHVGYSTPEHRAAIEKLGVSPLHRMSFQSMAYQQLAL